MRVYLNVSNNFSLVQVHRVDYQNPTVNQWGNKSYPVKVVTVGNIHKLSEVEKRGLGLDKVKGRKTPGVEHEQNVKGTERHLKVKDSFASPTGRPRKSTPDNEILSLAGEGLGAKAIAVRLKKRGHAISHDTVARRLGELKA